MVVGCRLSVGCGCGCGIGWGGEEKCGEWMIGNFGSWLKEVTADARNRCMDGWISTLVPNGVPEYGLYGMMSLSCM